MFSFRSRPWSLANSICIWATAQNVTEMSLAIHDYYMEKSLMSPTYEINLCLCRKVDKREVFGPSLVDLCVHRAQHSLLCIMGDGKWSSFI